MPPKATKKPTMVSDIPVWCRYDEAIDVEAVVPHPRNPNKHPDKQVALLAKIIRAQGWRNPVVCSRRSGFVVKGHGRLEAARLLGVEQVPVEWQAYADEATEYADMIADNRIAELADPDQAALQSLLEELGEAGLDMDLTAFDEGALALLLGEDGAGTEEIPDSNGEIDEDAMKETANECPKCGFEW